ncbi:hypothetical protein [Natrinema marinum]|uniref:hypothetical protein n=1 Tax=Natrinema marinum TaxID=2961598 RepID=UPI0020C8D4C5|nr:hypothetical protein [Natrinema marinum]
MLTIAFFPAVAASDPMCVVPVRNRLFDRLHDDTVATRRAAARAIASLAETEPLLVELRLETVLTAVADSDERVRKHAIVVVASTCPIRSTTKRVGPHNRSPARDDDRLPVARESATVGHSSAAFLPN